MNIAQHKASLLLLLGPRGSWEAAVGAGRACTWVAHVPHVSVKMLLVAGCEDRKINEKRLKQYRELRELLRIQGSGEAGP